MPPKILIIEDDRDLAELARIHLRDQGYDVSVAYDGPSGDRSVSQGGFDLIVLDLMLPGKDGMEICRGLRARSDYTPLLILTARTGEVDRVLGLELGADDYVTKPVSMRELVARVKAILRRVEEYAQPTARLSEQLEFPGLSIDLPMRKVELDGVEITLTAKEFDLLVHFASHPGRVFTRRDLLDAVWGYGYEGYQHTVNSHINRLRSKIEKDASKPDWILTVWGVGYKFREGEPAGAGR